MSNTEPKSTRVIFTFDRLGCGGKKFYTRLALQKPKLQTITTDDSNTLGKDPVIDYLTNHESSINAFEEDEGLEVLFDIDVLVIDSNSEDIDNGLKQYHASFNSLVENPFVSINGISKKIWRSWCVRLFFNGEFDSDYKYEIMKRNEEIEWVVKVEHGGIWKVVFLIGMEAVDIDIDEHFIEDLESFYEQIKFWKRKSKEWALEREKKVVDMSYLSKIDGLYKSSRDLKQKVLTGYTPLINHLLEDRRRLKRKLEDADEVVISSVRKRRLDNQTLHKNETNENGKITNNLNKKEKNEDNKADAKKEIQDGKNTSEDENIMLTLNAAKRKASFIIEKENDIKTCDSFSDFGSSSDEFYLVKNTDNEKIQEKVPKEIKKTAITTESNCLEKKFNFPHKVDVLNKKHLSSDDQISAIRSQNMQGRSNNSIEISEDTCIEEPSRDYFTEDLDSDKTDA